MSVKINLPPVLSVIELRQWCIEQASAVAANDLNIDVVALAEAIERWVLRTEV